LDEPQNHREDNEDPHDLPGAGATLWRDYSLAESSVPLSCGLVICAARASI
jgi:hypothetical protein